MSFDFSAINYWAVLVAAVTSFVIGGVWYTVLFGQAWARLQSLSEEQLAQMAKDQPRNFGIFIEGALMGVVVLSAGSANLHRLFSGAGNSEVACLARLWLDDRLGRNSESRTLGIIFRQLRQHQSTIKAVVAYSDPSAGHTGTITEQQACFT